MPSPRALVGGIINRFLSSAAGYNDDRDQDKPLRCRRYGDLAINCAVPTRHDLADEGSYFVTTTPTPGTGLTWVAAQTTYSATAPNFLIQNLEQGAQGRTVYLDFLTMVTTAAMTAATGIQYAITMDSGQRAPTTNNMTAFVQRCLQAAATTAPNIAILGQSSASASVIPALTNVGYIAARDTWGGINVANDVLGLVFGENVAGLQGLTAVESAQVSRRIIAAPPIIIPPGWAAAIHIWAGSSSASFAPECTIGYWAK